MQWLVRELRPKAFKGLLRLHEPNFLLRTRLVACVRRKKLKKKTFKTIKQRKRLNSKNMEAQSLLQRKSINKSLLPTRLMTEPLERAQNKTLKCLYHNWAVCLELVGGKKEVLMPNTRFRRLILWYRIRLSRKLVKSEKLVIARGISEKLRVRKVSKKEKRFN